MTDERRNEILAMKFYQVQAELLRIETVMNQVSFSQWPQELFEEYCTLEGVDEINEGTRQTDLTSHRLQTKEQWGRTDD
jgi:hypothetical protein